MYVVCVCVCGSLMDVCVCLLGARIRTVEEGKMSVFAPSRTILDKVKKKIEETKNEVPPEVCNKLLLINEHVLLYFYTKGEES